MTITEQAIRGGADAIQFRDKHSPTKIVLGEAARILQATRAAGVPLILNDRVDVALAIGADGVHLGQDDLPIPVARHLLGPTRIIGKSTHSLEQALAAEQEGADYIAVGPVYTTPTKPEAPSVGPELIGRIKCRVQTPLVIIGGIDRTRLPDVLAAGAECVAVVRAVCGAEDPEAAARELKAPLVQFIRTAVSPRL